MPPQQLFPHESAVAARQPKTDRLILARFLKNAAGDLRLDEAELLASHDILKKWADLESSGKLQKVKESQLQGDFLAQVWGQALGYPGPADGVELYHRIQHHVIAGQTPDAVLGHFRPDEPIHPLAVMELKGPTVNVDRDRSGGRTAVDQCWDYLVNTPPDCRWGVVSNMVSFRLYERDSTKRAYEHFSLQSLRDFDVFRQFYILFQRRGLIDKSLLGGPRAAVLLKDSRDRQREVSDKLYDSYSHNRTELISFLHFKQQHPLTLAIEMAQRLLDRIMFIAFCEDRGLLPKGTIPKTHRVAGFHAATNPRWQNFKNLFQFTHQGNPTHEIPGYNGGLFAPHAVDELDLPAEPWTTFFKTISSYDFADEVNLDVLGHLFERSITELEKLKESGFFGGNSQKAHEYAVMPQSVKRKQLGVYYTPQELTSRIVQYTVEELIAQRLAAAAVQFGVKEEDAKGGVAPDDPAFWRSALDILRNLKIIDPACGSGAFLFQAYNVLELRYHEVIGHLEQTGGAEAEGLAQQVPQFILQENLYGVDLSPEAVEITQLALWIRSAAFGQSLATLSENIVHGNSLVHDEQIHPAGFDWKARFPAVFNRRESGFDCVIGNPPWERIKLQEREFFSLPALEIATATNAAKRRTLVAALESEDPALYARYEEALAAADALLTYCRKSQAYPLTGKGDINTYAVFAELAYQLVAPHGSVGLLTPSGIASDKTTKDFFAAVAETNRLIRLFDFHNRRKVFKDVEGRLKFCVLNFGGSKNNSNQADFVFFAESVEDLEVADRHIPLSGDDIRLLNPNTKTCPVFRSRRDAKITIETYRRVRVLIDESRKGPTANPWGVTFKAMFHQTNDAELFHEHDLLIAEKCESHGNTWSNRSTVYLPAYEAKMCRPYDHRHGSIYVQADNWYMQGKTNFTTLVQHQNPEHLVLPRYWVEANEVESRLKEWEWRFLFAFRDVVRATDERTLIAHFVPRVGALNTMPLLLTQAKPLSQCALMANFNAFALDFIARQKISQVHMNFFIVEQLPVLTPDTYDKPCPWDSGTSLETWISERVLKLTCTAEDMLPLAEACNFSSGSFQEYQGRLNKWDEEERAVLMAELDAAYFHLYGIPREDAQYMLSTFKGIHQRRELLPEAPSTAEFILKKYDDLAG